MKFGFEVSTRGSVILTAVAVCCAIAYVALAESPAASGSRPAFSDESLEFFEREVRPLLVKRCFECHSGEAKEVQAGLRLDSREAVLRGGDTGAAIVPGKPKQSLLIDAINYGELYQMPPKSKLPAREIAVLTRWVDLGAPWPESKASTGGDAQPSSGAADNDKFDLEARKAAHWAWQPVQRPSTPNVQNSSWPANDIDRFVLAKLEAAGLSPADAADKRTLIRRAYFDVVGMPPPPEAVERFVNDDSPQAFERVVGELLSSPRFGERWARHWLDLVRYAETYGHEFDYPIEHAWQYRDYVIRALNADVTYDQFAIEHIAGDLLKKPRLHPAEMFNESIIGTGFWWFGEQVHAPVDVLDHEADRVDNQIDVLGKTFLGLTLGCARCHDHKFDAISTADVYSLWGFAKSARLQTAYLDPHGKIAAAAREIAAIQQSVMWLSEPRSRVSERLDHVTERRGHVLADFNGDTYDDWFITGEAFGDRPTRDGDWTLRDGKLQPLDGGLAQSGRLSAKFTGALRSKSFTIEQPQIAYHIGGKNAQVRLIIQGYRMDSFNGLLFSGCSFKVDHEDLKWHQQAGDLKNHIGKRAYIEILDDGDGWVAVDEIRFVDANWRPPTDVNTSGGTDNHTLGGTDKRPPLVSGETSLDDGAPLTNLRTGLSVPPNSSDSTHVSERLAAAVAKIAAIEKDIPAPMRVLAATDGDGFDDRIHIRGNNKTLGEPAPRRFLTAIAGGEQTPIPRDSGSGRLELARRIVSRDNPLFARVMVNRVWHHLFGRGIVASVDNFGVLGERPTHPELLDHLATQFIDDGYSVKRLIRVIMLSRTYQMASQARAAADEADPSNLLLHRQNIKRLEGEAIRDAILALSSRLNQTMYGPPVRAHLTDFMFGRGRPNRSGPLDGAGRRSIYLEVRRNFLSPMMLAFDTPLPASTVGRRNVSNVPAQALILMNDPFVAGQAKRWAERVLSASGGRESPDEGSEFRVQGSEGTRKANTARLDEQAVSRRRIETLYGEAFAREPSEIELKAAVKFVKQQAAQHIDSPSQESIDVWTDLCHVLFNAKEFTFIK